MRPPWRKSPGLSYFYPGCRRGCENWPTPEFSFRRVRTSPSPSLAGRRNPVCRLASLQSFGPFRSQIRSRDQLRSLPSRRCRRLQTFAVKGVSKLDYAKRALRWPTGSSRIGIPPAWRFDGFAAVPPKGSKSLLVDLVRERTKPKMPPPTPVMLWRQIAGRMKNRGFVT